MPNDPLLQIKNLAIGYQSVDNALLKNLVLSGRKNQLIALIGPNGSGKSTLLRTISSLQKKLSGEIEISGTSTDHLSRNDIAKILSFVSTEIINVQNLRVKDLITLGRFPHTNWIGKISNTDRVKIDQAIDILNLREMADKFVNAISDGERQKVMIARALAQDTDIVILDEPTAFLDISNKYHLVTILEKLSKEQNKLIIFSTHDLNIALKQADIIWLTANRKIIAGVPEDLVLDGLLDYIFLHQDVKFDYESGDFIIQKEKNKKIRLVNKSDDNKYFYWTVRALNRSGYEIFGSSDNEIIIEKENNKILWNYEGQSFGKIESLLNHFNM